MGYVARFRTVEPAMKLRRADDGEIEVEIVSREGAMVRARIDGREVAATLEPSLDGGSIFAINGRRYPVFASKVRDRILVTAGPESFEFVEGSAKARGSRGLATPVVVAPMPGKVLRVVVS